MFKHLRSAAHYIHIYKWITFHINAALCATSNVFPWEYHTPRSFTCRMTLFHHGYIERVTKHIEQHLLSRITHPTPPYFSLGKINKSRIHGTGDSMYLSCIWSLSGRNYTPFNIINPKTYGLHNKICVLTRLWMYITARLDVLEQLFSKHQYSCTSTRSFLLAVCLIMIKTVNVHMYDLISCVKFPGGHMECDHEVIHVVTYNTI